MTNGTQLGSSKADRRIVTVLFADISGFTRLGETLDPEDLTDFLHDCVGSLIEEVTAWDGWVEKQIGDAILAVFGAPVAHEDDPARAVYTALGMHRRMRSMSSRFAARIGHEPTLHVGVNTGLVVMGPGIEAGKDRTGPIVVGDTVNVGARLQQAAAPGQVLVGEATFAATRQAFEYREMPPMSVKGKRQKLIAYECLSSRPSAASSRIRSPFFGREREEGILTACIDRAIGGRGQIIAVTGEAGIGKSRLVSEVRSGTDGRNQMWLEGKARSIGRTLSYWPFQEMIRSWAGITQEDGVAPSWAKLEHGLRHLFGDDVDESLPYMALFLGLDMPHVHSEGVKHLTAESRGRQIFRSCRRLFERIAEDGALVLVLDDLHWADRSSLLLVEHLLPLTSSSPVLFLCTWRAAPEGPLSELRGLLTTRFADRFTEIQLGPLSRESAAEMMQSFFPLDALPRRERSMVLDRAQGNPFFLEEIGRVLPDASRVSDARIPDSLRGLIVARIDKLPEALKDILRSAAVIGRDFPLRLLSAVTEVPDADLRGYLAELVERGLVDVSPEDQDGPHVFAHPLVQEVVYESILLGHRRELHRRVGHALETLDPGEPGQRFALLAYHYSRAEDWERANGYLLKAGDQAADIAADSEALDQYRRAMTAHVQVFGERWEPLQQAQLERKMAEAHFRRGDHHEAIEYLHRALVHLGRPFPRRTRLGIAREVVRRLRGRLARTPSSRTMPEGGRAREGERNLVYERAAWIDYFLDQERFVLDTILLLNTSERIGRDEGIVGASAALAIVLELLGMDRLSTRYRNRALALAERMEHPLAIGSAYLGQGLHGFNRGDWDASIDSLERAATAFRSVGDLRGWGAATSVIPWLMSYEGRLSEGMQRSQELLRIADEAGDEQLRAWGLMGIGMCLRKLGDLENALPPILKAVDLFEEIPDQLSVSDATGELGLLQLREGQVERAVDTLERAVGITAKGGLKGFLTTQAYAGLADAYLALAEQSEGSNRRLLIRAKDAARASVKLGKVVLPGLESAYRARGTLEWLLGRVTRARSWWERSLAISQKIGSQLELGRTEFEMGKRLRDPGYLARAETIFSQVGAQLELRDARDLIATYRRDDMP
jgi:class 3 adenylate cyclase/tetratricopeptide (TPR) repeat protein